MQQASVYQRIYSVVYELYSDVLKQEFYETKPVFVFLMEQTVVKTHDCSFCAGDALEHPQGPQFAKQPKSFDHQRLLLFHIYILSSLWGVVRVGGWVGYAST